MTDKNIRELFNNIIKFEPAERTLKCEFGYWGGTINRWYKEGLPKVKGLPKEISYGESIAGSFVTWSPQGGVFPLKDYDIKHYFGLDEGFTLFPYHYWIYPPFEEKIIYEDDKFIEHFDVDGVRKKILKDNSSIPLWLEWPVKNRKDWEKIKEEKFNLNNLHDRYAVNLENYKKEISDKIFPLGIFYYPVGFFGSIRLLVGEENLFILYYDDPSLVKDILGHLCEFWLCMAEELLSNLNLDIVGFWEDMAGKNGSMISPVIFKEYMTPYYKRITDFLKSRGINKCFVDTDGNVEELIPLFIEAGVNMMLPFERQAGNELMYYRKKYPNFVMMGGFDKNVLYKGKEAIDSEINKMECLISQGGYIPFCDHLIPPNVAWEDFKYYRKRLDRIIEITTIKL